MCEFSKRSLIALMFLAIALCPNRWASATIAFRTVALSGDQAPGVAAGQTFAPIAIPGQGFPFNRPQINDLGQVAIYSPLQGPGAGSNALGALERYWDWLGASSAFGRSSTWNAQWGELLKHLYQSMEI
jgi:hypothetical protein